MHDTLKILLVEDEPAECRSIIEYTESLEDVRIIAVTNTSEGALRYVKDFLPDAVILDLELHQGGGNGIGFLQELRELNPKPYPYVLVTTNNTSSVTLASTRQFGADFIMLKHQENYSAQGVVDFLKTLKGAILGSQNREVNGAGENGAPAQKNRRLSTRIGAELERIGISPKATGRKYLIDGIIMIYEGEGHVRATIAQKYSKSDTSVERAMQNAINAAWRKTDIQDLQTFYTARINSSKGVPTVTEFLHYYADKLKADY